MNEPLPIILAGLLPLGGIALLFYGFNRMHKYRLIRDIPRSKVRAVAMGLVEIHGLAEPQIIMKTPFSQVACVYYRYTIEEYRRHTSVNSKGRTQTRYSWDNIASGEKRIPFFAVDDTGRILVMPDGAEISLAAKRAFLQKAGFMESLAPFIRAIQEWDKNDEDYIDTSQLNLVPIKTGKFFSLGNRVGDRRYTEYFLEPQENLFLIGTAATGKNAPGNIVIKRGDNEKTYIISNKTENDILKNLKWSMIGAYAGGIIAVMGGAALILHLAGLL